MVNQHTVYAATEAGTLTDVHAIVWPEGFEQ